MCEEHYRPNSKVWYCKYCNIEIHSLRKLYKHYKVCLIRESIPKDSIGRIIPHNTNRQFKCEFCSRVLNTK